MLIFLGYININFRVIGIKMTFSISRIQFVVMASYIRRVEEQHVVVVEHILRENNFAATGLSEINARIGIDAYISPSNFKSQFTIPD